MVSHRIFSIDASKMSQLLYSPALVANLWDVTDRDIDKFAQCVFEMMHLVSPSDVAQRRSQGTVSLAAAVAKSREVCKLKYLTGAAPVIYGIPFYL
jgi:separase